MTIGAPQPNLFPDLAPGRPRVPKASETALAPPSPSFESLVVGPSDRAMHTGSPVAERVVSPLRGPSDEPIGRYKVEVAIGDTAVSFDAKPIVAPVAVASHGIAKCVEAIEPFPIVGQSEAVVLGEGRLALAGSNSSVGHELAPTTVDPSGDLLPTVSRVAIRIPRHVARAAAPSSIAPAQLPSSRLSIDIQRTGNAKPTPAGQSRAPAEAIKESPVFARLVAFDGLYRVRTRGAALTSDEIDQLAERIRAALREHGLADRPVAISSAGGAR